MVATLSKTHLYKTIVEVTKVKGKCPIHKEGDKIVIKNSAIDLKETDAVCLKALTTGLLGWYLIWERGSEEQLKVALADGCESWRCPEVGEPYSPYGPVLFKIRRVPME